jgi:3-methyladenine DNA glycosylase AlkD
MATLEELMTQLKAKGTESTRRTMQRHGAPDNLFGVKLGDLKPLAKNLKGQQQLALDLYATGNHEAMCLAGIVASGAEMTKSQLEAWAKGAVWSYHSEYTVPAVVVESPHALALARKWMKSKSEPLRLAGWNTYAGILATRPDDELDLEEIEGLVAEIEQTIDNSPNRVRYTMNNFVIAVGSYVAPLLKRAKAAAKKIGKVEVDMGDTSCKVPPMLATIEKIEQMGRVGKKRKTLKC